MNLHRSPLLALGILFGALVGCSSAPSSDFDPFDTDAPSASDAADDQDGDAPQRQSPPPGDRATTASPDDAPSSTPGRAVDGTGDGWDTLDLRSFDDEDHVVEGRHRWQGPDHLSFHAAVDTDDNHLYLIVDVHTDDVDPNADAVELRLRDPGLDDMINDLPTLLQERFSLDYELTFSVAPDGSLSPLDGSSLATDAIHTAGVSTVDGYRIEAAVSVDAFPYLRAFPLDALGFRLDVVTDHVRMSAATRSDGTPRYALYRDANLHPAHPPQKSPPRDDAIAVWQRQGTKWSFRSLEFLSPRWTHLGQNPEIVNSLVDAEAFPASCDPAEDDIRLVDAYEHRDGDLRTALWLCGTSADNAPCPDHATSDLLWSTIEPYSSDQWIISEAFSVLQSPFDQCPLETADDGPLAQDFSMLPLDLIGPDVWAIGFHRHRQTSNHFFEDTQAVLVDPGASNPILTRLTLDHTDATNQHRSLERGRIYLTDLNDQEGLDICQVDELIDQSCRSLMEDCQTRDRSHETMSVARLWNPDTHQFEDYPLAQHPQCRGSTNADSIDGYQLLLIDRRLGLIEATR